MSLMGVRDSTSYVAKCGVCAAEFIVQDNDVVWAGYDLESFGCSQRMDLRQLLQEVDTNDSVDILCSYCGPRLENE